MLCFQETNLKVGQTYHLKNNNGYFKNWINPGRASGGVASFVKNKYLRNNTKFSPQDLIHITTQLSKPFILVGDLNIRNLIWGSLYTDPRGKIVESILEDPNLILLNNGSSTRNHPFNENLITIHLTIASANIALYSDWDTLPSYNDSDHWPILIHFPIIILVQIP